MRLEPLKEAFAIVHPDIRKHALHSFKTKYTRHFLILEQRQEVAFLSVDTRPDVGYLVLYELFVPGELRNRGIGSRVLLEVEAQARTLGYETITLNPSPLESDFPKDRLLEWYKKRGYVESSMCEGELEKLLAKCSPSPSFFS